MSSALMSSALKAPGTPKFSGQAFNPVYMSAQEGANTAPMGRLAGNMDGVNGRSVFFDAAGASIRAA